MSLLDQVRNLPQQVIDRLKELEPLAREYEQLRKFAQRLGLNYSPDAASSDDDAQPTPTKRPTSTRARAKTRSGSAPAKASTRSSGRARASTSSAASRGKRATGQRAADSAPATNARSRSASGRTRKGRSATTSGQPSGARRVTARPGQRDEDVLRLVGENPGITVREIAEQLGVDPTGLYRVVKRLTDDGRLRRRHATSGRQGRDAAIAERRRDSRDRRPRGGARGKRARRRGLRDRGGGERADRRDVAVLRARTENVRARAGVPPRAERGDRARRPRIARKTALKLCVDGVLRDRAAIGRYGWVSTAAKTPPPASE